MIIKLKTLWNLLWSDNFVVLCDYGTYARIRRGLPIEHLREHFDQMVDDLEDRLEDYDD